MFVVDVTVLVFVQFIVILFMERKQKWIKDIIIVSINT